MTEFDEECWWVVYGPRRVATGVSRYKTEELGHMRTPNHLVASELSVVFHTFPLLFRALTSMFNFLNYSGLLLYVLFISHCCVSSV